MVRLEMWESLGGYWVVATETTHDSGARPYHNRLGACHVPATDYEPLTGFNLLAAMCEAGLDLAYGQVHGNVSERRPARRLNPGEG